MSGLPTTAPAYACCLAWLLIALCFLSQGVQVWMINYIVTLTMVACPRGLITKVLSGINRSIKVDKSQ